MTGWPGLLSRLPLLRRPPSLARGTKLLALADLAAGRGAVSAAIRARCHNVPLDAHTVLSRVLGRYKMLVDSRDLGLAPHLMLDGFWEYWTTAFVARRLRPGQVAWDVGANLGYFSVLMADAVGPAGRVTAFEPNPRLALLAERNLALNGMADRAAVIRAAVTARSRGTLRFRAHLDDPKNGRLVEPGEAEPVEMLEVMEVAVSTLRLDDMEDPRVDFIKVDVEGAEEAVWAGMQGVLDANPGITVLLEFNALRCREPARLVAEMTARFALRELRLDGRVRPVDANEMLGRREDTMLVLTAGRV
ncbi:FkbM family methyltransferase [Falsiroseomonas sp. CW058]|uniref:FkbM family methyltransferase n=1 Tax=Falsiroseomonas sp. CW058 TaxID=3388664 RepID=UPI003D322CF1